MAWPPTTHQDVQDAVDTLQTLTGTGRLSDVAVRGAGAVSLQAALPNLAATIADYDDATDLPVRQIDVGSSVGLGPNGTLDATNSVGARLFAALSPVIAPLGNVNLAHHNGSIGGSIAADWLANYDDAVTAAGGAPALLAVVAGMNDGMPSQYHMGQTFPFFTDRMKALITKAQQDGADIVLFTTPHPHSSRTPWSLGGGTPTYPDGQTIPADTTAGSVVQVPNANGVLVPASYRHLRINQALRRIAADTGTVLLDVEHYWFLALAQYGEDALFDSGEYVHPNLLGFQQSFFPAISDFAAAISAPTVRSGVVAGQRNSVPVGRTGGLRIAMGNGATLTVTLPANTAGRLTVMGTSGGGWQSVWSGSFVATGSAVAIGMDGSAFTTPGQLIQTVTGSTTDTTVAIQTVATGSGSVLSWAADYFTAY